MANEEYMVGDKVTVLSGAVIAQEAGLGATIVRKMTDADDYEVEYDQEQPGVSPIVHPDRLLLVSRAEMAEMAPETSEAGAESAPEASAAESDVAAEPAQES